MKFVILAVCSILFLTSEANVWIPVIKSGKSDTFKFNPESMAIEFEIAPKKALADLDFNLVTRFYDKSDKMLSTTSFRFQMKGEDVTKDFLILSTKKGNNFERCYGGKIIGGQVPGNIFLDLTNPNVFLINYSISPNFAGNKYCNHWRDMLAKEGIVSADIALWDSSRNTLKHLDIKYRVMSTETATSTFLPLDTTSTPTPGEFGVTDAP